MTGATEEMTGATEEATVTDRVEERPSADLAKVRRLGVRELGYRFIAGAVTSVAAGLATLAFGPRVGGVFLAFPAILAASLTLIAGEEDRSEAREDARGAVVGGIALAVFAVVAALALGEIAPVVAMVLAAAAWFGAALIGYLLAWFR